MWNRANSQLKSTAVNRPLSHGGHFESQENRKFCFCPSSLALDERLDGQNLLFQHYMIKLNETEFIIKIIFAIYVHIKRHICCLFTSFKYKRGLVRISWPVINFVNVILVFFITVLFEGNHGFKTVPDWFYLVSCKLQITFGYLQWWMQSSHIMSRNAVKSPNLHFSELYENRPEESIKTMGTIKWISLT